MEPVDINISVIMYQDGVFWIAQGLEYDITTQASSLPELRERFPMKVAAEVAISTDLGKRPLEGIGHAPAKFWRMFQDAQITLNAETPPVRIADAQLAPRIIPHMKVGTLAAAA